MTTGLTGLTGAVELLDRSLGYTRVVLADVRSDLLDLPTPCDGWSLGGLLAHMEDALDAFTEAAGGTVSRLPPITDTTDDPGPPQVRRLQTKACALLGAWSGTTPEGVVVAGHDLASEMLVAAAALEITVHGWDVGRALGLDSPLPDELAARLLPVARLLVQPEDRAVRFAAPRPVGPQTTPGQRLLAFVGRRTSPLSP